MAAVRGLRVSVKAEAPAGPALGLPSPQADSGLERGEPEPMEVEEGELEIVPVRRSLKELIPVRAGGGGEEEVAELGPLGPGGRKGRRPAPGKSGERERGEGAPRGRRRRARGETGSGRRGAGRPEIGVEGLEMGEPGGAEDSPFAASEPGCAGAAGRAGWGCLGARGESRWGPGPGRRRQSLRWSSCWFSGALAAPLGGSDLSAAETSCFFCDLRVLLAPFSSLCSTYTWPQTRDP